MNTIKFRIAAKTDVGLIRTNNEDNFQAASDLNSPQMRWVNNEICSLGDKGALIVVADGMGGMNAGEVASELAIETIREYFSPQRLTPDVFKTRFSIEKHMNDAIVAADAKIKAEAKQHPETKGMGTTIVIGWILDGKLYVSWCGDSRAYVYNPISGLHQISKDHSYVQSLVDKGSITREEAFDFPDSNIITRCLSDGATKAKPESLLRPYDLCNNDIIMLCTDGLSGMIRDEEIEGIMHSCEYDMDKLTDMLIQAACDAEGADNITICLCQILQGGAVSDPTAFVETERRLNGKQGNSSATVMKTITVKPNSPKNKYWIIGGLGLLLVVGLFIGWWFGLRDNEANVELQQQENLITDQQSTTTGTVNEESLVSSDESDNSQTSGELSSDDKNSNANPSNNISKKDTSTDKLKRIARTTIGPINQEDNGEENSSINSNEDILSDENEKNNQTDQDKGENNQVNNNDKDNSNDALNKVGNLNPTDSENVKERPKTKKYKVKPRDTYSRLAKDYGIKEQDLQTLNGKKKLIAGDTILIPIKN